MTANGGISRLRERFVWPSQGWWLVGAAVLLALPTLLSLARDVWSMEQGAHGPIVLATGLWLLVREMRPLVPAFRRGRTIVVVAGFAVAAPVFLLGAATGWAAMETAGLYAILLTALYLVAGAAVLRRLWFPLIYLLFLIPPPQSLMAGLTGNLKLTIATTATDLLHGLGYQAASAGPYVFIDQYQILVAAACSGMNTLVSLMAIGLFYIYLMHKAEWRYAAVLALLVLPLAVVANFVRVIMILMLMHYGGEDWGMGILHEGAGIFMFFVALGLLIAIDKLLEPLRRRLAR